MTNRLANATSPYLLQHQHNPVDWWEWQAEAFEAARRLDRPILLSVGYAACHWCHVMAHESFEDEGVAEVLNRDFVAIKVDREERPDIDAIYMTATTAMTGQGGWPMTCFLTPGAEPFFAGTYLPRTQLLALLAAVTDAWTNRREDVLASGANVAGQRSGKCVSNVGGGSGTDARHARRAGTRTPRAYRHPHAATRRCPTASRRVRPRPRRCASRAGGACRRRDAPCSRARRGCRCCRARSPSRRADPSRSACAVARVAGACRRVRDARSTAARRAPAGYAAIAHGA